MRRECETVCLNRVADKCSQRAGVQVEKKTVGESVLVVAFIRRNFLVFVDTQRIVRIFAATK